MHSLVGRRAIRLFLAAAAVGAAATALAGCACFGGPTRPAEMYTLEYPSPVFEGKPASRDILKVNLFSSAEAYRVTTVITGPSADRRDIYPYAWWTVQPAYLVTDLLLRDLRHSGRYRAVYSYRDDGPARFVLGGTVEEFLEIDGADGPAAVVAVNATLTDRGTHKDAQPDVLFQKSYRESEPMPEKSARALAAAMSKAVERLSHKIRSDVFDAATSRPTATAP